MSTLSQIPVPPSIVWNETRFGVRLPKNAQGKREFVYLAAGTPEQRQAWQATKIPPVPNAEQTAAYAAWLAVWENTQAGERMSVSKASTLVKTLVGNSPCRYLQSFAKAYGGFTIGEITPAIVRNWLDGLKTLKTANSQNTALKAVKAMFNRAVEQGIIDRNPIRGRALPERTDIAEREYQITADDEATIAANTPAAFNEFFRFCLYSGLRPGSVCTIEAQDCHESDGVFTVQLFEHKTAKRTGKPMPVIVADPVAVAILRANIARYPQGKLFRNAWGNAMSKAAWGQTMTRLKERNLISSEFDFYAGKHTFVTRSLKAGVHIAHISKMIGVTIAVLEKHYAHLSTQAIAIGKAYQQAAGKHAV